MIGGIRTQIYNVQIGAPTKRDGAQDAPSGAGFAELAEVAKVHYALLRQRQRWEVVADALPFAGAALVPLHNIDVMSHIAVLRNKKIY